MTRVKKRFFKSLLPTAIGGGAGARARVPPPVPRPAGSGRCGWYADITIVPPVQSLPSASHPSDLAALLHNPKSTHVRAQARRAERATWAKIESIRACLFVERVLDSLLRGVREAWVAAALPAPALSSTSGMTPSHRAALKGRAPFPLLEPGHGHHDRPRRSAPRRMKQAASVPSSPPQGRAFATGPRPSDPARVSPHRLNPDVAIPGEGPAMRLAVPVAASRPMSALAAAAAAGSWHPRTLIRRNSLDARPTTPGAIVPYGTGTTPPLKGPSPAPRGASAWLGSRAESPPLRSYWRPPSPSGRLAAECTIQELTPGAELLLLPEEPDPESGHLSELDTESSTSGGGNTTDTAGTGLRS
ncbi:hypothetical protein H696_00809 [Fonticula alba]|uniref:Uncharacterized protein n=1 Tax=Fonticula alba TaxID=691883 RepID=A0A058ZIC1_FONAL|nr:hypothetical protein H696_00809 [Fonticula alba]KCV73267.1 hypothetical protein H696_00809 [Fonticula alba]|eukprot:XP_009492968.1 hypothetical protein H696_00809 [Fonticula alba]